MKSKRRWLGRTTLGYIGVVAGCFLLAMVVGWSTLIEPPIDAYAYDFLFRRNPPEAINTQAIIVAIDDATFQRMGSVGQIRVILTRALNRIAEGRPKVVASDVILHDPGDPVQDRALAAAMARVGTMILPTDMVNGHWEDPAPVFNLPNVVRAHIKADPSVTDGVTRILPLEVISGHDRRWALSLQAFSIANGMPYPFESPDDIVIGHLAIPAPRRETPPSRPMRILYSPSAIPQISVADLVAKPELAQRLTNKVVFLGVTSISATGDRVMTPLGGPVPGVDVNVQAFETMERGKFLTDASNSSVLELCVAVAVLAGCIFAFIPGWPAYVAGALLLLAVHSAPLLLFRHYIVFPYLAPLATAWLTVAGAASYQSLVVGRQLRTSEVERARYRQAIHFVTHEMRSPLTAIQGSSEMMGRYNLSEEKRKQMAAMINSESKRLGRMIQTFLDVERLADGQMELKHDLFVVRDLVAACLERVRPLAERKAIKVTVAGPVEGELTGDRELMEYAIYNLLTNAVKYSPAETEVLISAQPDSGLLRLSIKDQGMGMDAGELKQIFTRFYRTKRAEASGESGTGIGLSIVDQVVQHHGGRMEVISSPGKGSCFTVVLPAHAPAARSQN